MPGVLVLITGLTVFHRDIRRLPAADAVDNYGICQNKGCCPMALALFLGSAVRRYLRIDFITFYGLKTTVIMRMGFITLVPVHMRNPLSITAAAGYRISLMHMKNLCPEAFAAVLFISLVFMLYFQTVEAAGDIRISQMYVINIGGHHFFAQADVSLIPLLSIYR